MVLRIRAIRFLMLVLFCASAVSVAENREPYRVLVLNSYRNSLPVNADWYNGLVRGFTTVPDAEVWLDTETLDLARVRDAGYLSNLGHIFHHKYGDPKPQLIISTDTPALRFLLEYGEKLFPGVSILFLDADSEFVASQKLPPNFTGITAFLDIAGTLELALRVHPATQRVAVIVGVGPIGERFERRARQVLQPYQDRLEFLWLKGIPLDELTAAVHQLPQDSVVLYLVQLQDRNGKSYVPANMLKILSQEANAPMYGLWDTLLGYGVVGGRMVTIEKDGFLAGQMALRILAGERPATIPIVAGRVTPPLFDGREIARWHIDEARLPAGSQLFHRQPVFWEEYRTWILGAGLLIGVQGLWILALLMNRSRLRHTQTSLKEENTLRRAAEAASQKQRRKLEKFSKERSLGLMVTAIAHEINQPLIAVQNYVQAAKQRISSNLDQPAKLTELLEKAGEQTGRAGDIIQRIRNLVTSDTPDLHPVPLQPIIELAVQVMTQEIESRGCVVKVRLPDDLPPILADELQIQLVLVNLLRNAVRSVKTRENLEDRVINIQARRISDREVQVEVLDRGPGIPEERATDLFEPLSSDKAGGMGMGLAICRLIIEAHGGHIGYEPNPSGGAILRFTLRVAKDEQE
jgi:signal transduction histidine kinase